MGKNPNKPNPGKQPKSGGKKRGPSKKDARFAPPGSQPETPLEKIHVPKPGDPPVDDRFPRRYVAPEARPDTLPEIPSKPATQKPAGRNIWVNLLTGLVVILTIGVGVGFVLAWQNPYHPLNPFSLPTPLPQIITATFLPPTETPLATATEAATLTATAAATELGLALPTQAADEQTTPNIGTPTPLGGGQNASDTSGNIAYPFVQLGEILYTPNENERGCNWASIAGTVYDQDGTPRSGLGVRITELESEEPITVFTGSSSRYPDGFEYVLNNAPLSGAFGIQVVTPAGVPLSQEVMVVSSERCTQNVLVINFEQVSPF
jgi:hypothetical protein